MNKNDFYKELMQNYTFNEEEIRKNALKRKFARNHLNSIKLATLVSSVAVCTVLVGTVLFTQLGRDGGVAIEPSALADMSAEDRIKLALENAENIGKSDTRENLMITFSRSFAATEVNDIFAQYTTEEHPIQIKTLYFEDGTKASGDDVGTIISNGDSRLVKGAAINCSLLLFKELNTDTSICLIELMTAEDEQAAPIDIDTIKSETLDDELDITEPPVATDAPVEVTPPNTENNAPVDVPVGNGEDEDIDLNNPNLPPAPDTESEVTAENPVVTLPPVSEATTVTDPITGEETSAPETTEVPVTEPEIPVITLPTEVPKSTASVSVPGAANAYFVGESTFLMTTGSTFELYTLKNGTFTNVLTVYGDAPKIHWLSTDGKYAIMSACDSYGARTAIYFIDTISFISTPIDLSDVLLGSSSIKSVAYNAESEALTFMFVDEDENYIGVAGVRSDGSKNYSVQAYSTKDNIALLAMNGSSLYFAESKNNSSAIHKLDIVTFDDTVIKTYGITPKFSKNTAFNRGIIIPNENDVIGFTEIFDAKTEKFLQTDYFIATVSFSLDGKYFTAGDNCYMVDNGAITALTATAEIMKAVDYKNSLSQTYVVSSVADGVITVKPSSYSADNMSKSLVFNTPTADSDTEIRRVFENAVGVNNLFSEYTTTIGEYHPIDGINSIVSARALINEYYSTAITEEIFKKCELTASENRLFCKIATGLKPLSVSECTLVLESKTETTAKYTLYKKRGSFNGKAGYTTTSVTFIKENDKWKLATALN